MYSLTFCVCVTLP